MYRVLFPITVLLCVPALLAAADFGLAGQPGPYEVETQVGEWIDKARDNRDVPWKVFLPKGPTTPSSVIVFSPGGGGSRDDASGYLGQHLASHGFASFHIQHRGSDSVAFRQGAQARFKAIRESRPSLAVLRQQDVPFAVNQIERMAKQELRGRIDPRRLGMSGFSFGAITTLITAGQTFPELGQSLAEPRFRAAFALSPSPRHGIAAPLLSRGDAEKIYDAMLMPVFHLTGTQDKTPPPSVTMPQHRQLPFQLIGNVDQYLLVLNDAVHPTFGGRDIDYAGIEHHRELIKMAAVVFWRAYLLDDMEALDWLRDGGYQASVGGDGRFELKPKR